MVEAAGEMNLTPAQASIARLASATNRIADDIIELQRRVGDAKDALSAPMPETVEEFTKQSAEVINARMASSKIADEILELQRHINQARAAFATVPGRAKAAAPSDEPTDAINVTPAAAPPDEPADAFNVTPAEAVRFVDAIGGEEAMSQALRSMELLLAPPKEVADLTEDKKNLTNHGAESWKEALYGFLRRLRNEMGGSSAKHIIVENFGDTYNFLEDYGDEAMFEWLITPSAELELSVKVGLRSEELAIIRSIVAIVSTPATRRYDGYIEKARAFDFTFTPWSDSRDDEKTGAQLVAVFASAVKTYKLLCQPGAKFTSLTVQRKLIGNHTVFRAHIVGSDVVFPVLQPWLIANDLIHFFGKQGKEIWSYEKELYFPLLAWTRNPYREEGQMPGAIGVTFDLQYQSPVVRLSKVIFKEKLIIGLEPWCVGGLTVPALLNYARENGLAGQVNLHFSATDHTTSG